MTRAEALRALVTKLLGRDEPPTLVAQMRALWRVPKDWTHRPTARVVPTPKPQTLQEWIRVHGRKSA